MNKIYIIWIWWIWISAIARYYLQKWYNVLWSDKVETELTKKLKSEWIDIFIWERPEIIDNSFEKVIYTEAISNDNSELKKSKELNIITQTYPESLKEISQKYFLIRVAWSHGKSTTSSMTAITLKNSTSSVNAVIWTILKEFDNKNCYFSDSKYMVIEACEYKRSFLNYNPNIAIITNIDLDHLDYYKDLDDYIDAFRDFCKNVKSWWTIVLNSDCPNSMRLYNLRNDITYVLVWTNQFLRNFPKLGMAFPWYNPILNMKIPWKHILFDAHLVCQALKEEVDFDIIKSNLENYSWVWRRSEIVWITENQNILISDYWHHPTEIKLNLKALKEKYINKKILTIFQPHQYSRSIQLIEDFKNAFTDTDILIVPNIYESRDNQEDKSKMTRDLFVSLINHKKKIYSQNFENTLDMINYFDNKYKNELIIILQWAWDIDDLRYKIKTT